MTLRRLLPWIALVAALAVALVIATRPASEDESVEARVERLTEQLRCPTCQGLSVADSPSSTARAISDDVRRRVEDGDTDAEIKTAYVDRYGEWILLRPSSSGIGAVVWALPVAAVVLAAGGLVLAFRRWRASPTMTATPDDERLVAEARQDVNGLSPTERDEQ